MMMFRGYVPRTEVPSPGIAAFIGFAAQAKPIRLESAGASALHTLLIGLNSGNATGTQAVGAFA